VISTVEKKIAKTQAFDWLRYFVIQNTSIWLASLFPFRNGVETNSTKFNFLFSTFFFNFFFQLFKFNFFFNEFNYWSRNEHDEEKDFAEKHSKIMLRMRSTFSREIVGISLVVELGL
jgi:hypothetical protein